MNMLDILNISGHTPVTRPAWLTMRGCGYWYDDALWRRWFGLLCGLFLALFCTGWAVAEVAPSSAPNPDTGKPFATVWRLRGDVVITDMQNAKRHLKEGDTVLVGQIVRAAPDGEAVLKTLDAGMVALRPGAEFVPERFAADGLPGDHQSLRLISGALRIISGWIAQINRQEHRVITNSAAIGVRGTDHEPYVLSATPTGTAYSPGTYDLVHRGATSLFANGARVDIDVGRVGFARDPKAAARKDRAMLTLLMPVLLTHVPNFYVPGAFDTEMDQYSATADAFSQKQLQDRPGTSQGTPSAGPQDGASAREPSVVRSNAVQNATPDAVSDTGYSALGCQPTAVAKVWLNRLDNAIAARNTQAILDLFAPTVVARATVRRDGGSVTMEFDRADMVQSTLDSVASLTQYQQRRVSLSAALTSGETSTHCGRISVQSVTIEQGLMNGKPYRFEALEDYVLEQQGGQWRAVSANTSQR